MSPSPKHLTHRFGCSAFRVPHSSDSYEDEWGGGRSFAPAGVGNPVLVRNPMKRSPKRGIALIARTERSLRGASERRLCDASQVSENPGSGRL